MLDFSAGIVLFSIVCLIVILYKEWLRPSSAFFLTIIVFLVSGVVNTKEALSGFANEQLATIVLLLVIAGVFQKTAVISSAFELVFKPADSEKKFLTKMFAGVGFTSAFLNNTPIVAVLMPYVYDWCKKKNIAPSKMLIPLSYATILGGCITLVGTSSHLIVNGIAEESKATPLQMFDFMLIGIIMLLIGWLYFMLWGYKALPEKKDAITEITSQSRKFFVETHIKKDSPIIGKTVESAGLRKLSGLFLIEILRREKAIKPVSPDEVLEADDVLFFGGHTDSIAELTNPSMGFTLPKACNIPLVEKNTVVEVVISHNSRLVDKKIMDSDFRGKYDGAILAVHRNGEKLEGKLGEINIKAGDVLLVLTGKDFFKRIENNPAFYLISKVKEIHRPGVFPVFILVAGLLGSVLLSALGIVPLLISLSVLLSVLLLLKIVTPVEIRNNIDFGLAVIIALGLVLGKAMVNSGAASLIAENILNIFSSMGVIAILAGVFITTSFLTSFMTNRASIAIVLPVAISLANALNADVKPFILAVAFSAAANFATPIGYQTNLMVYGPGNYSFKDYLKIGTPLTLLYFIICITLLSYLYIL